MVHWFDYEQARGKNPDPSEDAGVTAIVSREVSGLGWKGVIARSVGRRLVLSMEGRRQGEARELRPAERQKKMVLS